MRRKAVEGARHLPLSALHEGQGGGRTAVNVAFGISGRWPRCSSRRERGADTKVRKHAAPTRMVMVVLRVGSRTCGAKLDVLSRQVKEDVVGSTCDDVGATDSNRKTTTNQTRQRKAVRAASKHATALAIGFFHTPTDHHGKNLWRLSSLFYTKRALPKQGMFDFGLSCAASRVASRSYALLANFLAGPPQRGPNVRRGDVFGT